MKIVELKNLLLETGFLTEIEKKVLSAIYFAQNCKATAPELAKILGYSHFIPVNGIVGKLGKKIALKINIPLRGRDDGSFAGWDVLFKGEYSENGFQWILKDEVKAVLDQMDWIYFEKLPEEVIEVNDILLKEGAIKSIYINAYERNPIARKICLENYGYTCKVCDFDFEKTYGDVGKDFIHVHHLVEISKRKNEYVVDPINDLIPICPNCHAIIHRKKEKISIEELRKLIVKMRNCT